jgi:hypothetical protein
VENFTFESGQVKNSQAGACDGLPAAGQTLPTSSVTPSASNGRRHCFEISDGIKAARVGGWAKKLTAVPTMGWRPASHPGTPS